jgi:hypothetical protein
MNLEVTTVMLSPHWSTWVLEPQIHVMEPQIQEHDYCLHWKSKRTHNFEKITQKVTSILIESLNSGAEHWSFSRLGTYCLMNFYGMVRQCVCGHD